MKKTTQKIEQKVVKKDFITTMGGLGYSMIGDNLSDCGNVIFKMDSFYEIQQYNTEAQSYKNKIVGWVGKNWLYLIDENNEVVDKPEELEKVKTVFSNPNWKIFKEQYFTHYFCSGDIYFYNQKNLLDETRCQILDSRTMQKYKDDNNNIVWFRQTIKWKPTELGTDKVLNSIVRYNPNLPIYWASIYESIVYDAFSEKETAKRNFYFFKNSAMPNVIFMLNPELTDTKQIQELDQKIKDKYKWTENSNKHILSSAITDAKILDVSNKEMDMLGMREFFIQKMWVVFQIDPRIIGFIKDVGSYASIKEIRKEALETLAGYAQDFENDLNKFYKTFVDKKFPYIIKLDSETFDDREAIEQSQRSDLELGIISIEEVRQERGLEVDNLPENAKRLLIKNSLKFLDEESQNVE